jgi:DNA-binding response OmpR family regulator
MSAAMSRPLLRVLVVDDERDTVDSLGLLLEFWGHEVFKAGDGRAALEIARSRPPEIVLLDIGMPGLDGRAVARQLRGIEGRRLTIIAVSGFAGEEDRKQALEAGCDHYLVKPINLDDLKVLLDSVHNGKARQPLAS